MAFHLHNEQAGTPPAASSQFRHLMRTEQCLVLPGAYDCISALAIQQAGFPACYMTGAGTAAAMGYPDIGLITMTEMVANASRISNVLGIPLISDADTGYGNEVNVARTVMEFERAGVAGIHIEDQVFPKRCGHLDGKVTVGRDDFASKIRAAVAARRNPDFLIIARTDSIATSDLDEAIVRGNLALEAGADMVFIEAPPTLDAIRAIPKEVKGATLLNQVSGGKTPQISFQEAADYGYKVVITPGILLRNAIHLFDKVLDELKQEQKLMNVTGSDNVKKNFERFGLSAWLKFQGEDRL